MTQSLLEEIVAAVEVQFTTGISKDIIAAAVSETATTNSVARTWVSAQLRQGVTDLREVVELALKDELLLRRLKDVWEEIDSRIIYKLVDREFDRLVASGSVVEGALENGETAYERKV